jgi:sulfhydrogenase subunit gamma (sulfur reductase)
MCGNTKENIFLPKEAKIVKAKQVTETEKHFTLKMANGTPMKYSPGQILEVSLFGFGEIPIGFASSPTKGDNFDIVIRNVGRVSGAINKLNEGDSVYVRGPLGNGFDLEALKGNNILVVAGGIGLCPTRSIIQYILDKRSDFKSFTLFYGARDPKQQMFLEDLENFRCSTDVNFHETVDRGDDSWKGNVGVITNLFGETEISPDTKVIICGPPVMFKFVIMELRKIGISDDNVYLDLERRMKCGVGKCGHCQINDKYVCVDGPVFSLSEIMQMEEAI